jgi:membrane protein
VWEVAKVVYADIASHTVHASSIYGSLSAIPVFLAWTYLSWIILLFGARIAYAAQTSHPSGSTEPVKSPLDRELLTVRVMRTIAEAFDNGAAPPDADYLALTLSSVPADVEEAVARLTSAGLVREADAGLVPSRALRSITLAEVRAAARTRESRQTAQEPVLAHLWTQADAAASRELTLSLEELVRDSRLPR